MKHVFFLGAILSLSACVVAPVNDAAPEASESISEETFDVIAKIDLDGGSVMFIDETIGADVGVGILEVGRTNLEPLHEQKATPLEIFRAIAPSEMNVPEVLYKAHDLARLRDPAIPEQPREMIYMSPADLEEALKVEGMSAVTYHAFQKDTSNCWGWGQVTTYDPIVGNPPWEWDGHKSTQATDAFRTWTTIPDGNTILNKTTEDAQYEQSAELIDMEYATTWGHERAFSMCVTHAEDEADPTTCRYNNTINYRVRLLSNNGTIVTGTSYLYLTGYGQGLRYRSSTTDSRKFTLQVWDLSQKPLLCKENYEVNWRSRYAPSFNY